MKQKVTGLSQQYVKALEKHLQQGPHASIQPALGLGRQAVTSGLGTLDLARIHEHALITLDLGSSKNGLIKQAEIFFTESIIPIMETHRATRQGKNQLKRANDTLKRRTFELAGANRQLHRDILRRKSVEAALKKSGEHYTSLLKDSQRLQKGLRLLTHQVLATQEVERKNISHELQDEVAQTLLGVNVRLLLLKQEASGNNKNLKKEIASTQRLVVKSTKFVKRVARKYGNV